MLIYESSARSITHLMVDNSFASGKTRNDYGHDRPSDSVARCTWLKPHNHHAIWMSTSIGMLLFMFSVTIGLFDMCGFHAYEYYRTEVTSHKCLDCDIINVRLPLNSSLDWSIEGECPMSHRLEQI